MRISSAAIVVLTGAICIGAATATATPRYMKMDTGWIGGVLLLAGGVCFLIEFIRTWNN